MSFIAKTHNAASRVLPSAVGAASFSAAWQLLGVMPRLAMPISTSRAPHAVLSAPLAITPRRDLAAARGFASLRCFSVSPLRLLMQQATRRHLSSRQQHRQQQQQPPPQQSSHQEAGVSATAGRRASGSRKRYMEINEENILAEVIEKSHFNPVLMLAYNPNIEAQSHGPPTEVMRTISHAARSLLHKTGYDIVQLNIAKEPGIARDYGVIHTPCLLLFSRGTMLDRLPPLHSGQDISQDDLVNMLHQHDFRDKQPSRQAGKAE